MLKKINLQLLADPGTADPGTGAAGQQGQPADPAGAANGGQNPDKTFSQSEVDDLIEARLARERKKWQKASEKQPQDPTPKAGADGGDGQANAEAAKLQRQLAETTARLEAAERKDIVLDAKVAPKFAGYVVYEVAKLVNDKMDFEDALEAYLKKNPQYIAEDNNPGNADQKPAGAQGQRQQTQPGKLTPVEEAFYNRNPNLRPKG